MSNLEILFSILCFGIEVVLLQAGSTVIEKKNRVKIKTFIFNILSVLVIIYSVYYRIFSLLFYGLIFIINTRKNNNKKKNHKANAVLFGGLSGIFQDFLNIPSHLF
jgi:hypothetical protein